MTELSVAQRLAALPGRAHMRAHMIDGPSELRFRAALDKSDRMIAALSSLGLRPGDRIVVATDSDVEMAPILVACLRAGIALVPLSPDASASEVEALVARAEPALIIADQAAVEAWGLTPDAAREPPLWIIAPPRGLRERLGFRAGSPHALETVLRGVAGPAGAEATLALEPARDLLLLATSGSTGAPKLVRVTVGNLIAQADTFRRELGMDGASRVMNLSPLVHVDGLTGLFVALWNGHTLVRPGRFTVARLPEVLHAVYRYRVTHALVVPTFLQLAVRLGEDLRAALATGDLRLIVSTAAPLSEALWREVEARAGVPVVNMFGLTETGNVLFTRAGDAAHHGTLGRAVDCEARVVTGAGEVAADGVAGELEVRGASVTPGYLGEDARRDDAWFATGDVVRRDAAGIFHLVGRSKNVIISGGRNVYPEEVDAALCAHPDVIEAVTVGVPDEIWGERVESAVVLRAGAAPIDRIARHAAERLSPFKHPRALHVRDALPRGQSGKPAREAIRESILGAHAAAAASASTIDQRAVDLEQRVIAIAAELFRVDPSSLSRASAPGAPRAWDSLAHLQLVQRLEEVFDIELAPREITRIDSLGHAVALIAAKL